MGISLTLGDRVFSRRHKGEIVITRASRAGGVGRKIRQDGQLEDREVVVYADDVRHVRLSLLEGQT